MILNMLDIISILITAILFVFGCYIFKREFFVKNTPSQEEKIIEEKKVKKWLYGSNFNRDKEITGSVRMFNSLYIDKQEFEIKEKETLSKTFPI